MHVAIVGAGVVGLAIALKLSKEHKVTILEKNEDSSGPNQSTRNSGVIHAGIYYDKRIMPLRAKLCVEGNKLLYPFAEKHNVHHKKTGKLVVATTKREEEYLLDTKKISEENKVTVKELSQEEIKELEPNVSATKALFFPDSGIITPLNLLKKLKELCEKNNVQFKFDEEVTSFEKKEVFMLNSQPYDAVINVGGINAPKVAKMINEENNFELKGIKGSTFYYDIPELSVKHNVYPVPHGYFPDGEKAEVPVNDFKQLLEEGKIGKTTGVHLSPTLNEKGEISTRVTVGPLYRGNIYDQVKDFFPKLKEEDIKPLLIADYAKIKNEKDFVITKDKKYEKVIHLLNIDSPGLTSSLAIAKYVKDLLEKSNEENS